MVEKLAELAFLWGRLPGRCYGSFRKGVTEKKKQVPRFKQEDKFDQLSGLSVGPVGPGALLVDDQSTSLCWRSGGTSLISWAKWTTGFKQSSGDLNEVLDMRKGIIAILVFKTAWFCLWKYKHVSRYWDTILLILLWLLKQKHGCDLKISMIISITWRLGRYSPKDKPIQRLVANFLH